MSAQRYTHPTTLARLAEGRCPECGHRVDRHDGCGGPNGCTLTDNGVARRINQYRFAVTVEELAPNLPTLSAEEQAALGPDYINRDRPSRKDAGS